ncbi:hypothetical protein HaLaN_22549 [Haematococcus lacustris]|uniref:Uncharacterized protein n=1 Tax=Haematococcus lacustris TaxID=44745 RepID=A0A6A0A3V1_HAELA|nr:hypothetical protein HaLaN_22549 [Haematococcus lacustris]
MLTDAHCNWRRVTHRVTHLDSLLPGYQLPGGHFADCPCCAGSGEGEDYKLCLCGDAVTKLSSYSGVGQATTAIQPHLNSHLDCKPPPLPNHSGGLEYDVQHRSRLARCPCPTYWALQPAGLTTLSRQTAPPACRARGRKSATRVGLSASLDWSAFAVAMGYLRWGCSAICPRQSSSPFIC